MAKSFQRIVTAHDSEGRAVVLSTDTLTPKTIPSGIAEFALVWTTEKVPADNFADVSGADRPADLTLRGGSVIRIVDMLPGKSSPMHRSFSIDYGIVLSGALELELDGGQVVPLRAGDIVVQRGTNHLWRNPSPDTVCRIAFVLIEAQPLTIGGRTLGEVHP